MEQTNLFLLYFLFFFFFFCGYISNYFSIVTVQEFLICELRQRLKPLSVFTGKPSCQQIHKTVKTTSATLLLYICSLLLKPCQRLYFFCTSSFRLY